MRCQKVRSFLSAYCNDELDSRRKMAISDHLSDCAVCRKEEAFHKSIKKATPEIGSLKVSDSFNDKLLNRIAQERFKETRTKAYLPKPVPVLTWGRLVPVVASTFVMALVALSLFFSNGDNPMNEQLATTTTNSQPDDYLRVQPTNNPNMTVNADKSWSLNKQLDKAERITNISRNMSQGQSFNTLASQTIQPANQQRVPFAHDYYRIRPVIKVYVAPSQTTSKGGSGVY